MRESSRRAGRLAAGERAGAVEGEQDRPLGEGEAGLVEQPVEQGAGCLLGLADVAAGEGGSAGHGSSPVWRAASGAGAWRSRVCRAAAGARAPGTRGGGSRGGWSRPGAQAVGAAEPEPEGGTLVTRA